MRVISVDLQDQNRFDAQIAEAVEALRAGKIIVYPTDTLYGLGCDALNERAVKMVQKIKKSVLGKPLSVMVKSVEEIMKYAFLSAKHKEVLNELLPGAFTFIMPGAKKLSEVVIGDTGTVGIRVPDNIVTRNLLEHFENPIITTSVSIGGAEPLNDPFKIVDAFSGEKYLPDMLLDAGRIKDAHPSIVVDLSTSRPRILRTSTMGVQETLALLTKLSV
ncbi:threonylcarbamoyl-AMP synthase [Patescibacteria group bacterium]|nr:MAG: threonylcarbamoyl-AMP synthase [Patescibacteria group bacterium]